MHGDELPAEQRRQILAAALTLGVPVGMFGAVFGVGAVANGASVAQACLLSVLVFSGASQFSVVSEVSAGATGPAALGGAILLAARNMVYGLAMSRVIGGSLGVRLVAAHVTIDESTAMSTGQSSPAARRLAFWATGAIVFACWNTATFAGAAVGANIDTQAWGLDMAFPAGFVAMLAPHVRNRTALVAALLGAAICIALVPFTPNGVPILCAAAAVLIGLPNGRRPQEVTR